MSLKPFTGSFTQQEPIAEEAIAAAVEVMKSGRLHRYNIAGDETPAAASLEAAYADYQDARYCLACASGGHAMQLALRSAGVGAGDQVLTNAFTLAPVPGAIAAVGAEPILVEINDQLVIDLDDLRVKATNSGAKILLLSLMRGHIGDMDRLTDIVRDIGLTLIEDCAHTMGATWKGKKSGNFGLAGCFSTQTYKHINSGEGGLLTSDDAEFMARAIVLSGSYMLYERHGAAPASDAFEKIRLESPNCSARMDNLRAAILLPQIAQLENNIQRWNERYRIIEQGLRSASALCVPIRPDEEHYVGSSIQFTVPGISASQASDFVAACKALGVELKWFGADEPVAFTSSHHSWRYFAAQDLPQTDRVLSGLFDMRVPLTFSLDDCHHVADIIVACSESLALKGAA